MQIFNDFSTEKKDTTRIFSDEEVKHTSNYLQDDDVFHVERKVKSLETERNLNRKYKLDSNNKLTKEFSQDFLEEYKGVHNPYNTSRVPKKNKFNKKVYESDINEGNKTPALNNSDSNLDESRTHDKSEEDEELFYYNS
jgi:hypothetical protein